MNDLKAKLYALMDDTADMSAEILAQINFRKENKRWLDKTGMITLTLLHAMDALNISQKELAVKMGVSPQQVAKILKGHENMTLQTITKIEAAVGVELINITQPEAVLKTIEKMNKKRKAKQGKS